MSLQTPILFLIFNRLDTTKRVFAQIKKVQPSKLFIAADGPRASVLEEHNTCASVREWVINSIDWPCEVKTLFRETNLGCGKAVSGAITWFFEHVEEGIILEDDCLPNSSFFRFCEELLWRYKYDENVCHISGNNFQFGKKRGLGDYYFSRYPHIWGWATWRRAWRNYKYEITPIEYESMKSYYSQWFPNPWVKAIMNHNLDSWDIQWGVCCFLGKKISILPNFNLVDNIGFSGSGTHTISGIPAYVTNNPSKDLNFPLKHPKYIKIDNRADLFFAKNVFRIENNIFKTYFINQVTNNLRISMINICAQLFLKLKIHFTDWYFHGRKKIFSRYLNPSSNWVDIEYFDETWRNRIAEMAKYIPEQVAVLDLGCGKMWLKEYLKNVIYYPVDYKYRGPDTIICDFNKIEFPNMFCDYAFVSGCLEYVVDYRWFIASIANKTNTCVISYCCIEQYPNLNQRRKLAWVNSLSKDDLIKLFDANGMVLSDESIIAGNSIFVFRKNFLLKSN